MYMRKKYQEWGLESDGWDRAVEWLKNTLLVAVITIVLYVSAVVFLCM